jgi:hypothetical protein
MSLRTLTNPISSPLRQLQLTTSLFSSLSLSRRTYRKNANTPRAPVIDPLFATPRKQAGPAYDPIRTDPPAEKPVWSPLSVRSGTIGVKKGMSTIWDSRGQKIPVTVVQVRPEEALVTRRGLGSLLEVLGHEPGASES